MAVDVAALSKKPRSHLLLDARAPARYRGEQEPIDRSRAVFPRAQPLHMDNVRGDGRFKSAEELKADFQRVLGDHPPARRSTTAARASPPATTCSPWSSPVFPAASFYAGSWSEWLAASRAAARKRLKRGQTLFSRSRKLLRLSTRIFLAVASVRRPIAEQREELVVAHLVGKRDMGMVACPRSGDRAPRGSAPAPWVFASLKPGVFDMR